MSLTLSPYALTTVARLKAHLGRTTIGETDISDRAIAAINSATAWMERRTARRLKCRNWRTAVTAQVTTTASDATVDLGTVSDFYEMDDIRLTDGESACIPAGTRVDSINSGAGTAELSNAATAPVTQASVVIGSRPLVCDGSGDSVLYAPEWPLVTLWAAYSVDAAGNRTALNATSYRLDEFGGRLELPFAVFPEGEQNIELECRAGYREPTVYTLGHPEEWFALERICTRVAEIFYSDDLTLRGRATDISMGGVSTRVNDLEMPGDVLDAIWPFVRTR